MGKFESFGEKDKGDQGASLRFSLEANERNGEKVKSGEQLAFGGDSMARAANLNDRLSRLDPENADAARLVITQMRELGYC